MWLGGITMKIALIDDEPAELAHLSKIIRKQWQAACGMSCTIDTFCNGKDFLSSWKAGEYGVIVLDIYLDGITGIEIARKSVKQTVTPSLYSALQAMNSPVKVMKLMRSIIYLNHFQKKI